jgi:hypothetical protein
MSKAKKKQVEKEQERVIKDMVDHGFAPVDSAGTIWCRAGESGTTLLKRCDDGSWKCFSLSDNGNVSTFEGLPDEAIVDLYCFGSKRDAGGKPDKDAIIAKLMDAAFSVDDDDDEDADERIEETPYEYSEDGVDTTHELYEEDFDVLEDAVEQAAAAMKKDDREAFLDALIEVYWKLDSCEVYDDDDEDDYDDDDYDDDEDNGDTEDDDTAHTCRCCCGKKSK